MDDYFRLMEQLLFSQLTGLRIESKHGQHLRGRMGYGGEVLLLQKESHYMYI
jgi:hypothetical protein